jgi:F0F1-type ATP synthase epsilon subunit
MVILISEEKEYAIEEIEKLFRSACLGEINIFHDHNRIIARLCYTLLKKIKEKNEDEMEKN